MSVSTKVLRIVAADDEPDMRDFYRRMLPEMGHQVVGLASNGRELVDFCAAEKPDLIIADIRMPQLDGIEAAKEIWQQVQVPVILVSSFHDEDLIKRAQDDPILAYLVKPIEEADLETAICIAMSRFERLKTLQKENAELRQTLADRKLIERAKGIVMKRAGMGEAEAFRRLQKISWDRNQKLVEIAQIIITTEEALMPSK